MHIGKGEKFAQLVLAKVGRGAPYQVTDIHSFEGDRGGGFGSTTLF
jgi:dUTPase